MNVGDVGNEGRGGADAQPRSGKKRALSWVLAIAAFAFIARAVPVRDLLRTLEGARLVPLGALAALYFCGVLAWAARYRALLRLARVRIGLFETWRITLESQAGGILLPGGVGGDALRVAFVVGKGATLTTVIAAVLLDRAIGLATLAGLAAVAAAGVAGGGLGPMPLLLGALPVALALGLWLVRVVKLAPGALGGGKIERALRPVLDYLGDPAAPGAMLRAAGFSVVNSAVQLVAIRGIIFALGVTPILERWVYTGTTLAFIVAAIPALPGGWGTSDAAFVLFLGKAGLAASTALAVSLLYRLFWYASGGVGALLYLLRQNAATPRATREEPAGQEGPRTP